MLFQKPDLTLWKSKSRISLHILVRIYIWVYVILYIQTSRRLQCQGAGDRRGGGGCGWPGMQRGGMGYWGGGAAAIAYMTRLFPVLGSTPWGGVDEILKKRVGKDRRTAGSACFSARRTRGSAGGCSSSRASVTAARFGERQASASPSPSALPAAESCSYREGRPVLRLAAKWINGPLVAQGGRWRPANVHTVRHPCRKGGSNQFCIAGRDMSPSQQHGEELEVTPARTVCPSPSFSALPTGTRWWSAAH